MVFFGDEGIGRDDVLCAILRICALSVCTPMFHYHWNIAHAGGRDYLGAPGEFNERR